MIRSIGVRGRTWAALVLLGVAGGCAPLVDMPEPSPDGPRISQLTFSPTEIMVGCPVRATFRLDTTMEEIVSAKGAWVRRHGRSAEYEYATVPIDLAALHDQRAGEIETRFIPRDAGTFYYYLQVGDRAGRMSNVLRATLAVDPAWTDPAPPCPALAP